MDRAVIRYFETNSKENLERIVNIGDDVRYFVKLIIDKMNSHDMSEPVDKIINNIVEFEKKIAGENKSEYVYIAPKDVANLSYAFLDLE